MNSLARFVFLPPESRRNACKQTFGVFCENKAQSFSCENKHATLLMCNIETHSFSFPSQCKQFWGVDGEGKSPRNCQIAKTNEKKLYRRKERKKIAYPAKTALHFIIFLPKATLVVVKIRDRRLIQANTASVRDVCLVFVISRQKNRSSRCA